MPIRANWPESESKQYDPRLGGPEQTALSAAIEKRRPMEVSLDRLNGSIDELKNVLGILEKRLEPFLSAEPPNQGEAAPIPREGTSPLAGAITSSANDIYLAINYIRRIAGRIE